MYGRLGMIYLAQKISSDQPARPSGALSSGEQPHVIRGPEELKMLMRLALVMCGILAAVTAIMAIAG